MGNRPEGSIRKVGEEEEEEDNDDDDNVKCSSHPVTVAERSTPCTVLTHSNTERT
jgi:hypothetical protein